MGNGSAPTWGKWLRRSTSRPGWSVARLARESGFNPSTIFEWIRHEDGSYVKVGDVVTTAIAAEEDPIEALCYAAGIEASGRDEDPEIRTVLEGGLPEEATQKIIADIYARRERDRERDMQGTQNTIELARLIEDQTDS